MADTCLNADIVSAKRGSYVTINRVRWPIYSWEVANKEYVDTKVGAGYTYISPMHKDDITFQVYIDEAASGSAGVVSTGAQYFTGAKTFGDGINLTNTVPGSSNSVVTESYVDSRLGNILFSSPMSRSGTDPITVSIASATGTFSGVISGTDQTLGGDITLSGEVVQTGNYTVSGTAAFTGTTTAQTRGVTVADTQVATGALVRAATMGCGFDAGSGWVSGCLLTQTGYKTYAVGAGSFRFTNYTDRAFPKCGEVISHAAWGEFTIPEISSPSFEIGIYIENTVSGPIIATQPGATNIQLMYGEYVQIGAIITTYVTTPIPIGAVIVSVVDVKSPFADRTNLTGLELANLISPINTGPNKIFAGQTDLSDLTLQMSAGGSMWEYGGNAAASNINRNTIVLAAWNSSTKPMFLGWQDNDQILQNAGTSMSIDTTQYNPDAAGTALSPIVTTTDYYVNIPILFNPSANVWIMQYPTELWTSLSDAQTNAHSFTRIWGSGQMAFLNVMAVVSVKAHATDLVDAVINSGEFFNYAVGGSSGATGSGGGAGTLNSVTEGYTASVGASPYYSSTGGQMNNFASDFSSYTNAVAAAVVGINSTNPGLIHLSAGLHVETNNMTIKPHLSVAGWTHGSTRFQLGVGGNIDVDDAFALAAANRSAIAIRNMRMVDGAGVNINLWTLTGTSTTLRSLFDFYDFECEGTFSFYARPPANDTAGDTCRLTCCVLNACSTLTGDSVLDGGTYVLNNIFYPDTGSTLVVKASNCDTNISIMACLLQNVKVQLTGSNDITVWISSSVMQGASSLMLINSGSGTLTVEIDRSSLPFPATTRVTKTGSNISFNVYDDEEEQDNLVYMSAAGNNTRSGLNLNNSVLDLPVAVGICTAGGVSSSTPYVVHCLDAGELPDLTDSATLPSFVSFKASNAHMLGSLTVGDGCSVEVGTMSGNITFSGGAGSAPSAVGGIATKHSISVVGAASQGVRYLQFDQLEALVTCNSNTVIRIMAGGFTGQLYAVGSGAVIDLTGVSVLDPSSGFNTSGGGVIRFPPSYGSLPGTATGMMKCTGNGILGVASAGSDYMVGTQNITISGDITASGALTSTVSATITDGAVTLAKMANVSSMSLIGNRTAFADAPSAISISSNYGTETVAYRDGSGNLSTQHFTQSYVKVSSFSAALTVSSPAFINYSGAGESCTLPLLSTVATGFAFSFWNTGANPLVVNNQGADPQFGITVSSNSYAQILSRGTTAGWDCLPFYAAGAGFTPVIALGTVAAFSVLGNMTNAAHAVTTVGVSTAAGATTIVGRDASGNSAFNRALQGYSSFTSNQTLTGTSSEYINWSGATVSACTLPNTASLPTGFMYSMYNAASSNIAITASNGGVAAATLMSSALMDVVWDGSSWQYFQHANPAAIQAGTIPIASLGSIAGLSVLGNTTTSTATITSIGIATAATANVLLLRDGSGNGLMNHAIEPYILMTTGSQLTSSTSAYINFSNGSVSTCTLTSTAGFFTGFKYTIYNGGAANLLIRVTGGADIATIAPAAVYDIVYTGTANTWAAIPYQSASAILPGTIPIADLASIASPSVIGNISGSSTNPGAVTAATTGTANTIVLRDTSGNAAFPHAIENYAAYNYTRALTSTTPAYINWYRPGIATNPLPETSGLDTGFKFTVYNSGTGTVYFAPSSGGATVSSVASQSVSDILWDGSSWQTIAFNSIPSGGLPITALGTITSPSVLGNISGITTTVDAVAVATTGTANTIVLRDTSGNAAFPHAIENYAAYAAGPQTLTADSPARINWTAVSATATNLLPATLSLATGFKFTMYNTGTKNMYFAPSSGGATVSSVASQSVSDIIWNGSSWLTYSYNSDIPMTSLGTVGANCVLGNLTTNSGVSVATNSAVSTATASSAVVRDAFANIASNNVAMNIGQYTTTGLTLTATHPHYLEYTGTTSTAWALPACSAMSYAGSSFRIMNRSTYNLTITNAGSDAGGGATIATGQYYEFICASVASPGTWTTYVVSTTNVYQTTLTWVITTGSNAVQMAGACTTTDATTATTLLDYDAGATGGSASAISVEYNILCIASTGSSGHFIGSFRGYCATGASPSLTVTTPFSSAISSLDAGVSQCAISAVGTITPGHLSIQVTGQTATTVKWTGEVRILRRTI